MVFQTSIEIITRELAIQQQITAKAQAEVNALKKYLDDTIEDLRQAERLLERKDGERLALAEDYVAYSKRTNALIESVKTWLAAITDTWGSDDTSRPALAVLENWLIIVGRKLPECEVVQGGRVQGVDDIPF